MRCRYLGQLNIDRDILSMGNFNIYDPMKAGKGLILDGQTLAHIEVRIVMIQRGGPGVDFFPRFL